MLKVYIKKDLYLKDYSIFSLNKTRLFYYRENNLLKSDFELLIFDYLQ